MKTSLMLFMALASNAAMADPTGVVVEAPIKAVLAPPAGYDDNDNIQVVIHGYLPNNCYTLARTEVERKGENEFQVRAFAYKQTKGVCAEGASLPMHMNQIVPFTTDSVVGQLKAGRYHLNYAKAGD